jgi:hypothetical protein
MKTDEEILHNVFDKWQNKYELHQDLIKDIIKLCKQRENERLDEIKKWIYLHAGENRNEINAKELLKELENKFK